MPCHTMYPPIEESVQKSTSLQVDGIWLYTSNFDSSGKLTDTCRGDSGGPLFVQRNGQVEQVGVLKVTFRNFGMFVRKILKFISGD